MAQETFKEKIARENREKFKHAAKKRKEIRAKRKLEDKTADGIPAKTKKTGDNPLKTISKADLKIKEKQPKLLKNGIIIPVKYSELKGLAVEKKYDPKVGIGELTGWTKETLIAYLTAWKPEEDK